jgi:hypothetical protein
MGAASSVRQKSGEPPCRFLDPSVNRQVNRGSSLQARVPASVSPERNVSVAARTRNPAMHVPTASQSQALAQLCSQAKEALVHAAAREIDGKLAVACEAYQLAADIYSKARTLASLESDAKAKAMKDAEVPANFPTSFVL